ncbi:uncharacterized protein MELLADRAFT_85740 [Melampsora larici-populina 98AG31]|uniref:Uncharacterized protein n=1 Tax=Melampsora larici-populina (strain 98AG31 / pathotype 3-4-7) TaxID=747676 RepID=F4RJL6_MELLP|nr:uncharacterized protein MELLADRAFT_85740 [Melampsora larici-populina 98AG31]EGG07327.1 hypothetical protein MELLADRAFT_85740 [Melampsora larici-populina 98AG31]
MSQSNSHTEPAGKRKREFALGFAMASDAESSDYVSPICLEPPASMETSQLDELAPTQEDDENPPAEPGMGDAEVTITRNAIEAIQLPIDGGYVMFASLRRIMAKTTLEDYLCFACLDEDEIDNVLPILQGNGVNHFDLFLFVDYVNKDQLRKWGISVGTCARIMVHAVMFYQFHVQKGA